MMRKSAGTHLDRLNVIIKRSHELCLVYITHTQLIHHKTVVNLVTNAFKAQFLWHQAVKFDFT